MGLAAGIARDARAQHRAGALSLPREVGLAAGALWTAPAREITDSWNVPFWSAEAQEVRTGRPATSPPFPGGTMRLRLSVSGSAYRVVLGHAGQGREVALAVGAAASGASVTAMIGSEQMGTIALDSISSEIDIFIDVAIVELFSGGRALSSASIPRSSYATASG